LAVWVILGGTVVALIVDSYTKSIEPQYMEILLQMSASAFSFLFGDRMYFHLKGSDR
jgi:hypothetical protein